jgi:ADP-dependent glucokinase
MKSFFSKIMLVGPIGPKLKYLLDEKIRVPEETMIENDEIHLIAEYQVNETFSDLVAPTANRFIVSHDIFNSKMEMLDKFFDLTTKYKPDLIILAGLHLLESQTNEFKYAGNDCTITRDTFLQGRVS